MHSRGYVYHKYCLYVNLTSTPSNSVLHLVWTEAGQFFMCFPTVPTQILSVSIYACIIICITEISLGSWQGIKYAYNKHAIHSTALCKYLMLIKTSYEIKGRKLGLYNSSPHCRLSADRNNGVINAPQLAPAMKVTSQNYLYIIFCKKEHL
jgi:hypothetical protein